MLPALHGGDLVVFRRESTYAIGDIVAYHIPEGVFRGRRIIHRIVGGDPVNGFVLRGDNNAEDDIWYPARRTSRASCGCGSRRRGGSWPSPGRRPSWRRVVGGFVLALSMTSPGPQRPRLLRPTTWRGDGSPASEPENGQSEKLNTPPSEETRK